MKNIGILRNTIQEYAWGSYTAIPELLGKPSPSDTPQAELWMGAHPKAPSMVKQENKWIALTELLEKTPEDILGKKTALKFKNRFPYLLKVLAAAKPLSIQAHPSRQQAMEGYEKENRLHISPNAPNRNYKDNNHKPECICALTHFWALNGFRNIPDILNYMESACPKAMNDVLSDFKKRQNSEGLKLFFKALVTMDKKARSLVIGEAVRKASDLAEKDKAFEWMIRLYEAYQYDIGIFAPLLLNLICLEPGQAMFLSAGTLHAYLEGTGIELMANSDNVLRGGLTPKHVDVPELLSVLDFEAKEVNVLKPRIIRDCEALYASEAEEFALSIITVKENQVYVSPKKRSAEIILCTNGVSIIFEAYNSIKTNLSKGVSVIIPSAVKRYSIEGDATLYKAAVPTKMNVEHRTSNVE